jgi:hypothetical protein
MELRIPNSLLSTALQNKEIKLLRLFASAKLQGHRSDLEPLYKDLKIHPRTGSRIIKKLVERGWAGCDGVSLFPRSWHKLKINKRGGLYLVNVPKDVKRFEALAFAQALKKIYRGRVNRRLENGKAVQEDYPTRYLCSVLGLKERRFKSLKASARRYGFISVIPQFRVIGKLKDYEALRKHLRGVPVMKRGRNVVVPEVSKTRVLI